MPCATLEQTFDAVADGRASHAVVPVESAIAGTVPNVYELLLSHDLVVAGERSINIDYVLVAPPGTERGAVRRVMSHPLALAQCADFFRTNRGLEAVSVFDTAGGVRLAMESGDKQTAAIASRRAAALYGAVIIGEHIQDHPQNWTRFLLVSSPAQKTQVEAPQKALVAFGLQTRARRAPESPQTAGGPRVEHHQDRRPAAARQSVRLSVSRRNGGARGRVREPGGHPGTETGDHLDQSSWCIPVIGLQEF